MTKTLDIVDRLIDRIAEQTRAQARLEADHEYTVQNHYRTIHELTDQIQDLKRTAAAAAMTPDQIAEAMHDLMRATKCDQYITCIKIIRQLTGYGLKEAKNITDQVRGL